MDTEILQRRIEMLSLVSKGEVPYHVAQQLAPKYNRTVAGLWTDWKRRNRWINQITKLRDPNIIYEAAQGLREVYRNAWFLYTTSKNESIRIAALKLTAETYHRFINILQSLGFVEKMPESMEHIIRWADDSDDNDTIQASPGTKGVP